MHSAAAASDQSSRPRKPKSREVSSRFLSPTDYGNQSPNTILSPIKQNPRSSADSRKHKSLENSGFLRGLWPSSVPSQSSKPDTLADCIGQERIKEREERKNREMNLSLLNRQRSCTEFGRFDREKSVSKENYNPVLGGSMRYTGKYNFKFPRKSSKNSNLQDENDVLVPGRFSVDENSLRKKSFSRISDSDTQDSESEYSEIYSGDIPAAGKDSMASYMAPTVSSRKHGIEVPSKFMHDALSRSRRWSSDSGHSPKPVSSNSEENSPKNFNLKNAMKKANMNWGLSPGWSGSPKSESAGKKKGLASPKPPTSPSRKGVANIFNLGIELLKGKKSSSSLSSPLGPGPAENVHQLRLLHNRLMQWRYVNVRGEAVNGSVIKIAESNFLHVWNVLIKLQHSVLQKRVQLQKEKLEIKLNCLLHSQIKVLETWGNIERQHSSAVSTTTDHLHSVICRIPLFDGAKAEAKTTSVALRHASNLAATLDSMLAPFSTVEKTVEVVTELAMVVIQEKQLLEECLELFRYISTLEIQERSLKSNIMQLRLLQQQILL